MILSAVLTFPANALEISQDAYSPVQWVPPPGTYMPIPPPRPDYYREWQRWGGRPAPYPPYPGQAPRWCRNVYGQLVRC